MYKLRIADQLLLEQLEAAGAVLIQGPKWCGKTTTAAQAAKSVLYMDWPRELEKNLFLAEENPEALLEGDVPRLIDEWQLAPQLWDAARFTVDRRGKSGQFIFTGSAVPADKSKIHHTGTGRFAWLTMRPMSLWESGESNGKVSLLRLFAGQRDVAIAPDHSLSDLSFMVCRGGWPSSLNMKRTAALRQAQNYVNAVCESDISRVDNTVRDATFARRLLRSYARHQGAQVPISTIYADLASSKEGDMVFDPFMGSGTSCVVASKLGRHYCGIEQNEEYCLWALKRLALAKDDAEIQGYADGVFWERNTNPHG